MEVFGVLRICLIVFGFFCFIVIEWLGKMGVLVLYCFGCCVLYGVWLLFF